MGRVLVAAVVAAMALLAWAPCAAQAAAASSPMAQRMQACTVCHGKEGRATPDGYFPRIAGKPAGYLYNQLVGFRDGRRNNAVMTYLVEHMSDAYLREIARYFAELELPYPNSPAPVADGAALRRGETLVREGDRARRIPACADCHGTRLTGLDPAVPGLVGLPRDYLVAQLGAWRNGLRRTAAPDCMKAIADRLSVEDVGAVTAWLAAQTPPANATPQAGAAAPAMPLECAGVAP